jgi:hypothetical protein
MCWAPEFAPGTIAAELPFSHRNDAQVVSTGNSYEPALRPRSMRAR